jgi:uncharacterized damage-inducible protein DinB
MMNLADVKLLVEYQYWARDIMLDAVDTLTPEQFTRPIESSFKSVRDTVVHMYAAELNWYRRWQGEAPGPVPADQFADPASVRQAWRDLEQRVRAFVEGLGEAGMSKVFEYKAMTGEMTSSPFWHMQQHVTNHGSYHRGQVTTMLRQLGAAPPKAMDLIRFYRLARSL